MFVSKIEQDIEQRTISRNSRYVKDLRFDLRHITPHFDHIEDLTSTAWRAALNEMHAGYPEAKKDGAISWRYAQRITVTARALLRYANTLGVLPVVPELPAPSNEDVELEQKRGEPVTERERDQFLRALRKLGTTRRGARRAHRIYTALLYTSLRKSGLERLTLKQIDFATKTIELPPRKAKSKKRREIALHPKAERAIKQELAERGNIDPEEPIFGGFDLREWFTEAMALAKIKRRLQPHHFTRHTAATIAGNRGATLAQLMALGSWETPAMAMRYVKIDAQRSREAQALLDAPLRKKAVRKKRGRSGAQGR